jgi:hypothetical protein
MTVTTLIHVNMVHGTGPTDARSPSLLLPGLENLTALHTMQVYCRDADGNQLRAEPAGWMGNTVRDVGSLAIVELHVQDQYWSLVADSFSTERPMVTGTTLDAFTINVAERRTDLLDLLADTATADAITTDPLTMPTALAADVTALATGDPVLESCATFIVDRTTGNLARALPAVFGTDFVSLDYAALRAFGDQWRAATEQDPIRRLTRLWELARMQTLFAGL